MPNLKLESLTTTELLDIRDYANVLLKERVAKERREIESTLARIGAASGARIGAASGDRPRRGRPPSKMKGVKVPPKYRNPETGETWAGRGMTPRWLQGRKLEDYAIDKTAGRKKRKAKRGRKKKAR